MATVVDICNLALSYIGEAGNLVSIDPDEDSYESELCKRFFPICRDQVLEAFNWGFATKRTYLALKAQDVFGWGYQYQMPSDSMKVIAVLAEGDRYAQMPREYKVEADENSMPVIYTDTENAVCLYTFLQTNTALYPEYFCSAVAYLLAARLSGSIIKGATSMSVESKLIQYYNTELERAKAMDAQQNRELIHFKAHYLGDYRG